MGHLSIGRIYSIGGDAATQSLSCDIIVHNKTVSLVIYYLIIMNSSDARWERETKASFVHPASLEKRMMVYQIHKLLKDCSTHAYMQTRPKYIVAWIVSEEAYLYRPHHKKTGVQYKRSELL